MLRALIRRHPLVAYLAIAFLSSWAAAAPFALRERGVLSFPELPLLESLVAFGPALAAFVVISCVHGAEGRAELWRSICAWRIGRLAFLLAVVLPLALLAIAYFAVSWKRGEFLAPRLEVQWGSTAWVVALLAAALSGPGEEPGWRGFAQRSLQSGRSALRATLIVALLWWVWHLPMFLYRVDVHVAQTLLFLVGLVAGSIWATSVYNASGGSVFAAILWHSVWNIASAMGRAFATPVFLTMTTTVIVLALAIVVGWGPAHLAPRLSTRRVTP